MVANFSFYSFFKIEDIDSARAALEPQLLDIGAKGTVLLAHEGVNLNVAGPQAETRSILKSWLSDLGSPEDFDKVLKLSFTKVAPFKKLKIREKKELCPLGDPSVDVASNRAEYIKPKEFKNLLEKISKGEAGDVMVIDNRNNFEFAMGTFKGARPANTRRFRRFAEEAEKLPKDKEIVMFCTGGIRCEKAGAYLVSRGFEKVKQLDGGILKYFEEEGGDHFEGRCFVFDERESVDGALNAQTDVE